MEDQPTQPLPNPNTKDEKLECLKNWAITVPPFVDTEHPEQVHSFYISCHKFIEENPTSFDPVWVAYMAGLEFNNPGFALKRPAAHDKAADDQNASEDNLSRKTTEQTTEPKQKLIRIPEKVNDTSSPKSLNEKPSSTTTPVSNSPQQTKQTTEPKNMKSVKPSPNKKRNHCLQTHQ